MNEIWKDIPNYEGLYQISNLGRVKSLPKNASNQYTTERILKPSQPKNDYCRVILTRNKKHKSFYIHRLVASVFIPNPNNYLVVNHKDENKHNNKVDNLEWCTPYYNQTYGTKNIRSALKRKTPIYQYDLKGNFIKKWDSIKEAQDTLKVYNISNCLKGQSRYKNVGNFIWKLKEEI
jgi:hypothetical protein